MPIEENRPSSSSSSIVLDKRGAGSEDDDENEDDLQEIGVRPRYSLFSILIREAMGQLF
ncbi:MAG: hypothetical protein K9N51_12715 [Candidatus Pacebacteria bacterium]|nr:hypothetical protein [Candidatus Paceibacterota bacterium]